MPTPEYYYHDGRHYMNTMTPHMNYHQMYGPTGGHGQTPLYSYLNHHTHTHTIPGNYMMYQQPPQHNRY
jgi:hypothetical protein